MNETNEITADSIQTRTSRRTFLTQAVASSLSLSTLAMILQSCAGSDSIGSSLSFANWASAETATRNNIDKALQAFETQNGVQVNNIGIPFDQVQDQLLQAIHANITMDVMELSGNWPYVLAATGTLSDLRSFVPQTWSNNAFPNSFEAGTYKGTLYAVPFSITPHGFWYNKTLLTSAGLDANHPPRTIDNLNRSMATLRAKLPVGSYPLGIDTSETEYALVGFWPWIWTFGGDPMRDDGNGNVTINWADRGTIAAFQWLQDAVKNGWTPVDLASKDIRALMANNQLVFKLDGPYLTGILADTNPAFNSVQKVNATFAVTTTPTGPGVTQPVTCADIHQLAVSSSSANKDLAWKLVDFLTTSPEVITSFLIPEGGMLPYRNFNTSPQLYSKYYADSISRTFISTVIPTMRPPAYGPRYSTAATAIVTALKEIAHGTPVRSRLQHLTAEVKHIYA
jgi:multiple sugar transport system substrate-binding protein